MKEAYKKSINIKNLQDCKSNRIILYGAGSLGQKLIRIYSEYGVNITYYADSYKVGWIIDGIPVIGIDDLKCDDVIIISVEAKEAQQTIESQLMAKNLCGYHFDFDVNIVSQLDAFFTPKKLYDIKEYEQRYEIEKDKLKGTAIYNIWAGRLGEFIYRFWVMYKEIPEDEKKSFTIDTSMNGQYNISEGCITHHFFQQEEISKGLLVKRHFKEAELSLYTAWVLREGKCYEAIAAWYHKEEDLKDAPHLEKVLHAMEEQLDRLTDGEYSKYATAKDAGEDNLSFKYWSDLQDIYFFIKDLREGKYHGSGSLRYEGRRGIPRIETAGRRLVDSIMGLIWKMDNDAPSTEDELYEAMGRFDDVVNKVMPDFNPEDWE